MSEPIKQALVPSGALHMPAGDVSLVRAGGLRLRRQAPGPFALDYRGDQPVLLVVLSTAPRVAGRSACGRGSFALLTPGSPARMETDDPIEVLALAFDDASQHDFSGLGDGPVHRGLDMGVRAVAQEVRRVMLHEGEASAAYLESLGRSLLVRALQALRAGGKDARRELVTPFNVRRVSAHVDHRLAERISVDELAQVAGLSRAHFSRAFAAATGETPHQFVLNKRLALVRRKLDDGAANLSLIAAAAGFSSHAHMTAAFRNAFGVTPSEYREARLHAPSNDPHDLALARLAG